MRPLWLHLLRGGGRSTWLEVSVPVVAGGVITFVLLLLLGLQQGLDSRAERTAWRTPEAAQGNPSALQAGYTDFVDDRPMAVIELARRGESPPDVPGMGSFPEPDEVWVSPALADLISRLPPDQLANRFPTPPSEELAQATLEHPDELVAVVGRRPDDPTMRDPRPKHQWNEASAVAPTGIDEWSTEEDLYRSTYRDIALLATVLAALPLVGLGDLASRLLAGRRHRRLALLRLLGARTGKVVRLTAAELATLSGVGALSGAVLHLALAPALLTQVPIKGGGWFPGDITPGPIVTLATAAAVVTVFTAAAVTGLLRAVRDPLGTYRRSRGESVRLWGALLIVAAIATFWMRSSNISVTIAFTVVVLLGGGLVAAGPLVIAGLGRLLARVGRQPATFIAGRRLADSPRGAWRTASGLAMAAFIAGFTAISLPVGLNLVGEQAERADRLAFVVPAASVDAAVQEAVPALQADHIEADVRAEEPPFWFEDDTWATLAVATAGRGAEHDRARTTIAEHGLGGPEMILADDLPIQWLVLDGVVLGAVVLPLAALVALASMVIGTLGRVYDQRETLTSLRLAGTPVSVMGAAQRRETIWPVVLLCGVATVAGIASGTSLGTTSLLNPVSIGILAALIVLGAVALLLADRIGRPVLDRVTSDLSERE